MKALVDPQVPEWGEANKPRIGDFLKFLDGELENRPFVAGKEFTVADITALVAVDFMKVSKLAVPDGLSNFACWREAVSGRPSANA
jgi:glutathione S-transferase